MFFDVYKALCDSKGISPKKAALEIGLSNSVTVKWKAGATPSGTTLAKIADYFGVSVGYLLGEEIEKTPTLTEKDERDTSNVNIIKIAGRDGSYREKRLSDEQLALFQSMLDQMKPVDDEI